MNSTLNPVIDSSCAVNPCGWSPSIAGFLFKGADMEQWKDIPGFEGYYQASDLGRIRGIDRTIRTKRGESRFVSGRILKPGKHPKGYMLVMLCKNGEIFSYSVHKLLLNTFVCSAQDGMECRHLDGDPGNNKLSNLKWGTAKENTADAIKHGHHGSLNNKRGEDAHNHKLTESNVLRIRKTYKKGNVSMYKLARMFNVSQTAIWFVIKKVNWKHI